MFEKEAEEIANKRCHEIMCFGHCSFSSPKHHRCGDWHREYECALKGAEFGYNKANEWHYVKDGDLPPLRKEVLWRVDKQLWLGELLENRIDFGEWELDSVLFNDYEICWKEIVLPEFPKECK